MQGIGFSQQLPLLFVVFFAKPRGFFTTTKTVQHQIFPRRFSGKHRFRVLLPKNVVGEISTVEQTQNGPW